ncbi:MAG: IctB family putative bicarbonate transporter [Cyanobacteria bacterium]|nr:IctB family putative bicarbonate transporter [Cyanobacteriota bacterium]MDW8202805.1 IctB family putative bicarbonate transporter [Cyanobacteriota bacterium SKYGB_h_bin112]
MLVESLKISVLRPLLPLWNAVTLATLPLQTWAGASYVHRWIGALQTWRKSSWLMRHAEVIGGILLILLFGLAPFVPNALTGLLLAACGGWWFLLTITDDRSSTASLSAHADAQEQTGATSGDTSPAQLGFTPIHLLVLLYWGVTIVATALSPVRNAAIPGLAKFTLYLLGFALMARVLRSPQIRNWIITLYLHVALLVSSYGLRQWFFGAEALATWVDPTSPLSKTTRVYSYLGNPNLLAGYLIPAVVFSAVAIVAWKGWLPKLLAIVMFGVNSACMLVTFSRGGWIGMVVAMFVLAVLLVDWWSVHLPRVWRKLALPVVLGGSITVVVLAVLFVAPVRDRVLSMFLGRGDTSNNFRINVWIAVLDMIRAYPILGIGPGNVAFRQVYVLFQRPKFNALGAYSVFLEVAVETGLVGLTCFLWLLIVTVYQGLSQLQHLRKAGNPQALWLIAAISTLFGMLGHGLVDTVWFRPEVNTLWWLMMATIASYYRPTPAVARVPSLEEPT